MKTLAVPEIAKPEERQISTKDSGVDPDSFHGLTAARYAELASLTLMNVKQSFINSASSILAESGFAEQGTLERDIRHALRAFSETDIVRFLQRANDPVEGWGYRDRDPVARSLFRAVIPNMLAPGSTVHGIENLVGLEKQPIIFLGNHLAALDVHLLDTVLAQNGFTEAADKITAVVGHKTFLFPLLRQMSLTFGTLQVPQSMSVSPRSGELGAREIAKGAGAVIAAANERMSLGDNLVVFPEGTRSRSGELYEMLGGVSRYIRNTSSIIVPWAHWGIEQSLPPDTFSISPANIHVRFGKPMDISQITFSGERRGQNMIDTLGYIIADLLPEDRQGAYGASSVSQRPDAVTRAQQILSTQAST